MSAGADHKTTRRFNAEGFGWTHRTYALGYLGFMLQITICFTIEAPSYTYCRHPESMHKGAWHVCFWLSIIYTV